MPRTKFAAGMRWGEETVRQIERDLEISLDLQWGPLWRVPPKRRRPRKTPTSLAPTALQLILSRGRARKIVWLDADDLKSAVSEGPEQPAARERIRSRVSQAITAVAARSFERTAL